MNKERFSWCISFDLFYRSSVKREEERMKEKGKEKRKKIGYRRRRKNIKSAEEEER